MSTYVVTYSVTSANRNQNNYKTIQTVAKTFPGMNEAAVFNVA